MKSEKTIHDYWQERASNLIYYQGEYYYTITSLPFYIKRREEMLVLLKKEMQSILCNIMEPNILDFGCGDGQYSILIKKQHPQCKVYGCDLSANMVKLACSNANHEDIEIQFKVSDSKIPFNEMFDLIFVNAVLAHIDESLLDDIVVDFATHLRSGGAVIVFEQTASIPRYGDTWNRRTEKFYEDLFKRNGFELTKKILISHPCYNWWERRLRKYLFRHRTNPNKSALYLYLCEMLMKLSYRYDKRQKCASEGNSFFVFKNNNN